MSERYIVTTASDQPVVRTDSLPDATRYSHVLKGRIIDRLASVGTPTSTAAAA